jgi:putative pre-16S rRNA nuclease
VSVRNPAKRRSVAQAILEKMGLQQDLGPRESRRSTSEAKARRILAVDYGRARIGLAIADSNAGIAQPLGTLERINRNEDMRRLREIVREHDVKQVVVGLPLRLDGTRGEMADEAERFANRIRKQTGVPMEMMDERLTSWEAERLLEEEFGRIMHGDRKAGRKKKVEKITVDSVAATVILRDYLDGMRGVRERH